MSAHDFGQHIRRLRLERGLDMFQVRFGVLSKYGVDISEDTLGNWEAGRTRDPGAGKLAALVEFYDADYEDVFKRLVVVPDDKETP